MKGFRKLVALLLILGMALGMLSSCITEDGKENVSFEITHERLEAGGRMTLKLDEVVRLSIDSTHDIASDIVWSASNGNVTVSEDGTLTAISLGKVTVRARYGSIEKKIMVEVVDNTELRLSASKYFLEVGDTATLMPQILPEGRSGEIYYEIEGDDLENPYISIISDEITALRAGGTVKLTAYLSGGTVKSAPITIKTFEAELPTPERIDLTIDKSSLMIGETATLSYVITPEDSAQNILFNVTRGADVISVTDTTVTALKTGTATIVASVDGIVSNEITLTVRDITLDPYTDVTKTQFYSNYTPAESYMDAYYRTLHNLMSGDVVTPDQAPIISEMRPTYNGMYVRNTEMRYHDSGNTYVVHDVYGSEVMRIYRSGAYITIEEVAAYVFAFGTVPPNYVSGKNMEPESSPWGEYLRLNHSEFSGNTRKYPYEPELPNISGCGGNLQYYEIDIGTTGTDCDPSYTSALYNDGTSIIRGAARIVYGMDDLDGNGIYEENEHYVFYTYNHYNDFQEYLNYYGGWGEMFGNITGGGTISSRYDYNPTPYVNVYWGRLDGADAAAVVFIPFVSTKEEYA